MGSSQSKEEVIIAQAGNSGGVKNNVESSSWSIKEIAELVVLMMAIIVIFWFCVSRCKATIRKKIREEISKSREQV